MIVFSNQILLAFSLYDLRCIILTIRKQIIAFKKGTFARPAPPTERQEGRLLPPVPLSGVPTDICIDPPGLYSVIFMMIIMSLQWIRKIREKVEET